MPPAQHPYFRIVSEKWAGHGRGFAKLASQAYVIGGLAGFQVGVGTVRPMQAGDRLLGIFDEAIGSTHADYANTKPINVEILFEGAEVFCPISSGSAALTELGDELDVVNGGLSLTTTESNKDFTSVVLNGSVATSIYAVPYLTVVY